MPDRDAALRVLGEEGWRLLLAAGMAVDDAPGDALAAASTLAARFPDAPAEDRAAALELVTAGRSLAAKLGVDERLLAVREAVEQATPARVATWHAHQLPAGCKVLEIGSGCGSDTLALAHRAANLIATDVDPVRAACTHMNLMAFGLGAARAIPGDGLAILGDEGARADAVFADPDRRPGGERTLDPERWAPPLSALRALAGGERAVFVKAAPALDPGAAPELDVTYVSHRGSCVEAFLAAPAGGLAGPQAVRAVLLPDDGPSELLEGDRSDAPDGPPGASLYVPDPAAIRARLLAELCVRHGLVLVGPAIAWLTGPAGEASPWLREHEIVDVLPLHPRRVRDAVAARAPAQIRVRCRGVAIRAPELENELRGTRGDGPALEVFAAPVGGEPTVLLAQRV